jgi:hypothetical protein
MSEKKVWFITGARRGMGVEIAKAALAAGSAVVATGRNTDGVAKAVGEADDLLVVKLDSTTIVNPGFFRTEVRTKESVAYAEPSLEDYAVRRSARPDCRHERELRFEDSCDEFPGRRGSHSMSPVASDPTMDSARAGAFESDGGR